MSALEVGQRPRELSEGSNLLCLHLSPPPCVCAHSSVSVYAGILMFGFVYSPDCLCLYASVVSCVLVSMSLSVYIPLNTRYNFGLCRGVTFFPPPFLPLLCLTLPLWVCMYILSLREDDLKKQGLLVVNRTKRYRSRGKKNSASRKSVFILFKLLVLCYL